MTTSIQASVNESFMPSVPANAANEGSAASEQSKSNQPELGKDRLANCV